MLAFGPDGFSTSGAGDGGGANDPPANAQNVNVLLGKILRININPTAPTPVHLAGDESVLWRDAGPRRDLGARRAQPVALQFRPADRPILARRRGQGAREEVDTPILNGGNYGWRSARRTLCTSQRSDPLQPGQLHTSDPRVSPTDGRCSTCGGIVHRGSAGACAERNLSLRRLLLGRDIRLERQHAEKPLGHDDEHFLVRRGRAGRAYVSTRAGPSARSSLRRRARIRSRLRVRASTRTAEPASVAVTAPQGCPWTAISNASWITITSGAAGSGNGTVSTRWRPIPAGRASGMER